MKTKLHYVLSIAMFLFVFSATAQNPIWSKIDAIKDNQSISKFNLSKDKVQLYQLNTSLFISKIKATPLRNSTKKGGGKIISIPSYNGNFNAFRLYEASVFSTELAKKYPNIKSYVGIALDNSGTRLRMSVSPQGIQTMISYIDKPTMFMQPVTKGSHEYVLYSKEDKNDFKNSFECKTIDELNDTFNRSNNTSKVNEGGANNQTLQKFRIAISTTSEYTTYHDDGNAGNGDEIADALAAINATLTRVNEIFETDMAVTFELVDATQLIYNNAITDPYSDAGPGAGGAWNTELQNTLTTEIGNAAYDVGHLFGASGGGGNAGCIGCVCRDDTASLTDENKGSGYTSPADAIPETDTFDIDYVAHEIGHQMGAAHTFAYSSEGSGVNSEPGSGTTIMAYAGITGVDDVAEHSDPYFHYHSIKQILDNLTTKSCQTTEAIITNNPPSADAGSNYNIPAGTAYILKGAATDADGSDNLTYCWEQTDSGLVTSSSFGPNLTSGSMNRSLPPTSSTDRYIPRFSSVVAGNITQTNPTLGSDWETVSNVGRTLNWALTVRDRAPATATGGQSSYDTMQITVEDVPAYTIYSLPNFPSGSTQNIYWNVGQTGNGTINCQLVNIKFSTDGGLTFPTTLASNTPNDGSETIIVPSVADTSTARILVEAVDNIFYALSTNFNISNVPDFGLSSSNENQKGGCGIDNVAFNFNFVATNGFSENTSFSVSGNPAGTSAVISPTSLNASGLFTMDVSDLDSASDGDYVITVTATSSITKSIDVYLSIVNEICTSVANTSFDTSTTLVQFKGLNNASAKPSGYSDYTAVKPPKVNRNSAYDLSVEVNTDGNYTTNTKVWVDWNQNCSFDDAGEAYDLGDATNTPVSGGLTGNSPFSVTIPNGAILGNTIMRVSTKYKDDGLPIACENGFDGEVEDYTIEVLATLGIEEFGFDNFVVFPNPNNGEFTVKLNSTLTSNINVEVYDLRGRIIFKQRYKDSGDFNERINLNHVQSGMYLLNVSDGQRKSTKKIIVE